MGIWLGLIYMYQSIYVLPFLNTRIYGNALS